MFGHYYPTCTEEEYTIVFADFLVGICAK